MGPMYPVLGAAINMTLDQARQLAAQITNNRLQSEQANLQFRRNPDAFLRTIESDIAKALTQAQKEVLPQVQIQTITAASQSFTEIDMSKHTNLIMDLVTIIRTHVPEVFPNVKETLAKADKVLKG